MLEKGIVLEIKEHYAIALKPGGEISRIKRKDGLQVGDQIYILPEDHYAETADSSVIPFPEKKRYKNPPHRESLLKRIAALAAMLVLVITLTMYPGMQTVYAVASFDGKQDLQLKLDQKSRIVDGYSYGNLISEEDIQRLKGKKLSDVGDQLITLMGDGPVLIGYASYKSSDDEDAQTERLLRDMFANHIILYLSGNGEDIELAESTQTSLGFHLAGEVVDDDAKKVPDEFLEEYTEYQEKLKDFLKAYIKYEEKLNQSSDFKEHDLSHLDDMDFNELLDEIYRNPAYEGNEDVLEILADKLEESHEDYKEQTWDSDEDDDESDGDEQDDDENQEDSDADEDDD